MMFIEISANPDSVGHARGTTILVNPAHITHIVDDGGTRHIYLLGVAGSVRTALTKDAIEAAIARAQ